MALYTVRSERLFCEQLDYNLLFRWFLDMDMVEPSFDHRPSPGIVSGCWTTTSPGSSSAWSCSKRGPKSDERRALHGRRHADRSVGDPQELPPKDEKSGKDDEAGPPDDPGNRTVNFHGEKRSNETHESTTDPEAKLARKGNGKEAKLSYSAHALMENRNGLLVDFRIDEANGYAERQAALAMLDETVCRHSPITVGADKGYDTRDFVAACRERNVVPHVAQNTTAAAARPSTHARRGTPATPSVSASASASRRSSAGSRPSATSDAPGSGAERTQLAAYIVGAAYNLLRVARLLSWRDQALAAA